MLNSELTPLQLIDKLFNLVPSSNVIELKLGLLRIEIDLIQDGKITSESFPPSGNIIDSILEQPLKSNLRKRLQFLKSIIVLLNGTFVKTNSSITGKNSYTVKSVVLIL